MNNRINLKRNFLKNIEIKINTRIKDKPLRILESKRIASDGPENYGRIIADAVKNKFLIFETSVKKVFVFTDDEIFEIPEEIQQYVVEAGYDYLDSFKLNAEQNGITVDDVLGLLEIVDCIYASYISLDSFFEFIKDSHGFISEMAKKKPQNKETIIEAVRKFCKSAPTEKQNSKKTLKRLHRTVNQGEEKKIIRLSYISELIDDGIIDYQFLVDEGIIKEYQTINKNDGNCFLIVDEVFRKISCILSNDELCRAFIDSGTFKNREEVLDYYYKNENDFYYEFATHDDIVNGILSRKIEIKDVIKKIGLNGIAQFEPEVLEKLLTFENFPKGTEIINFINLNGNTERYLSADFMKLLGKDNFMKIVLSQKIKYKNPLQSIDYIDSYGRILSDDIFLLAEKGFVNPEDLIKLTKFTSMEIENSEEYSKMIENLTEYYGFERLKKLIIENKINGNFVNLFNNLLNKKISEAQRKKYFEEMSECMKENEGSDEIGILLIARGLDIVNIFNHSVSAELISEMYVEEKIDEKDILSLYNRGVIKGDIIREIFSDEEIMEHYTNGDFDYRVLNLIQDRKNAIRRELENENIGVKEVLELYSDENGISIEDFDEIVKNANIAGIDFSELLENTILPEKVELLFKHYYISHDDLSLLVERKIITESQAENYASGLAGHEEYEALFSGKSNIIILTNENPEGDERKIIDNNHNKKDLKRSSTVKNDPEFQKELFDKIGMDKRHLLLNGKENSLDGYRIYSSEEYGIMIFFNSDKPQNATYIMSLQQGLYFIKNMQREVVSQEQRKIALVESTATKKALRETEHIKVRNASRGWGKNVIDSLRKLSTTFREKYKMDEEYRKQIEEVIELIREDYDLRK